MVDDLVQRAHRLDLSGMSFAGLARLSFELDDPEEPDASTEEEDAEGDDTPKKAFRMLTGRDIKSRDQQEQDGRALVVAHGGTYVHTYDEPDTSAWKRKRVRLPDGRVVYRVIRPVYEKALDDLRRGIAPNGERLDGLIVYDIDRLTRDNRDLEDAIDTVTKFHRPILDYTGTLDLLTENGRMVARMLVAAAAKQSADTSRRVKRKHEAMQQAGIPSGGTRPFGWNEDKRTLHPTESREVRKAVRRILTGASVGNIVSDWNRRGLLTTRGNRWHRQSVLDVLRNPRMCGYRMQAIHDIDPETGSDNVRVEVVYDEHGEPVIGQWEPMITVAEWDALREMIGAAPQRGDGHNARKYLLTGTLRCGKCDALLRGTKAPPSARKPEGYFFYTCPSTNTGRGCGGVKIDGPPTDAVMAKYVIARYEEEAAGREAVQTPQDWDKEDQLVMVRENIAAAKAARKANRISAERYYADLAEYDAEEKALLRERNAFLRRAYAVSDEPVNLRDDWENDRLSLSEQRSYIEKAVSAVIVKPAEGRRNVPVRERLEPVPRSRQQ
jgi:DNA invertase Pin-like site-specific DNA recombinase